MPAPNAVFTGKAYWDQLPTPPAYLLKHEKETIGTAKLEIYSGGVPIKDGARPNDPLEYRFIITLADGKLATQEDKITIQLTEIRSDGTFEVYGTDNIKGISPDKILRYNPLTKSWINSKGRAQNFAGIQRFEGIVMSEGKAKTFEKELIIR
ncbi:hypothetical protein D6825_01305 [Candidatus Woesearchaeota archaeon]|nr:MAG: hypothetical protein D6825_01305 [Candidatus Woesearchaeota archaeon]